MIDAKEAEDHLASAEGSTLDVLLDFGRQLLTEANDRTGALDAKATTILGWATAALAFLTIGVPQWVETRNWLDVALATSAILGSLCAAVFAALALRARQWRALSQLDWFQAELFQAPERLRKYHLIAMLEAHSDRATQNQQKGAYLVVAQWAIAFVAAVLAMVAISGTYALFVRGTIPDA